MSIKSKNAFVGSSADFEDDAPNPQQVHVLICALDYKGTNCPLTCTLDGNNMQQLCRQCGIKDVQVMYDNQCTKEAVAAKIAEMGRRVQEDDYFVFYYSGHGTSMADSSGDEEDGQDEALCFVGPGGQLSGQYFMTDDEFVEVMTENITDDAKILILTDCCHSGTIGDLENEDWEGRQVVSITGCTDVQTSGDIGKGGIFTHSMLLAIEKLKSADEEEYSVGMLYNGTVHEDDTVFHSKQDITINSAPGFSPKEMCWPLLPRTDYKAPLSQAVQTAASSAGVPGADALMSGGAGALAGMIPGGLGGAAGMAGVAGLAQAFSSGDHSAIGQQLLQMLLQNPQVAEQCGIPPAMLSHIGDLAPLLGGDGSPQDFLSAIHGVDPGIINKCAECSVM